MITPAGNIWENFTIVVGNETKRPRITTSIKHDIKAPSQSNRRFKKNAIIVHKFKKKEIKVPWLCLKQIGKKKKTTEHYLNL